VTSTCPAATCWPLSKCTASTISLSLAVKVTDSCAFTVPSACSVSLHVDGASTCVVTSAAAEALPFSSGAL
jgi:hypothetical protein